ncbi:MAG TPA: hypothetical protein VL688_00245, partial [Verrucomicrobiae bacterium]|nr:hypothetical protein [Verrucomicrobiae bacterium]
MASDPLQAAQALSAFLPSERIITDEMTRFALGTDASFYRLVPKLVVKVENEDETGRVMRACRSLEMPFTFRAAGTSLSGQ